MCVHPHDRRVVVQTKELADVELEAIPHSASSLVRITEPAGSGGWT